MVQTRVTELHNPSYGPPKKRKAKKKASHRPRSSSNPGPFVLTLGALGANPTRRKSTVAKKKKNKRKATRAPAKANRSRKAKRNGKSKGVSMASVRAMFKKKKNSKKRNSRRNPTMFGATGAKMLGITAGILGGVTIAKLVPPMLPAAWTASDLGRFGTTLAVAIAESIAAHLTLSAPYRDSVMAGAASQTLSVALNPILRSVSSTITLGRIRRGVGDFVPGNFPEPYNPIYNKMLTAGMATAPGAVGPGVTVGRYRGRFN